MKKILLIIIFFLSFGQVSASVVVNEVRVNNGEFIELYNTDASDVSLGNYYFTYYSSSKSEWDDPYRSKKFDSGATIKAKSYFLIALGGFTNTFDWQPYTSNQLSDAN